MITVRASARSTVFAFGIARPFSCKFACMTGMDFHWLLGFGLWIGISVDISLVALHLSIYIEQNACLAFGCLCSVNRIDIPRLDRKCTLDDRM